MDTKKSAALRDGVIVFAVLAVLTAIEYVVGVSSGTALLLVLALVKAGIVVNYYMHIRRLSSPEGGH